MLCSDTNGSMPAIRVSTNALKLAQEIETVLDAVDGLAKARGGKGQSIDVHLKVQPNRRIPWIDWTFRLFRDDDKTR